jgi:hypothetical protein
MKLTHGEIEKLYSDPGVRVYRPEPVLAILKDGSSIPALCYNLPEAPTAADHNAEYGAKLRALAKRVGLPAGYAASIQ